MSYYHGNFNISVMNNYFILKIPGWKLKMFQSIWKKSFFLHKISLLCRCSTFLKTKELVWEVAMIPVGMSLWFASWGQTSYFFLECSFPSFQLPNKFPWALHKHGKRKFLHVLRFSNKYRMATFYLCNVPV